MGRWCSISRCAATAIVALALSGCGGDGGSRNEGAATAPQVGPDYALSLTERGMPPAEARAVASARERLLQAIAAADVDAQTTRALEATDALTTGFEGGARYLDGRIIGRAFAELLDGADPAARKRAVFALDLWAEEMRGEGRLDRREVSSLRRAAGG